MNLLALARRLKSESGRSGIGPAAVATAADNDLRIVNAIRDSWLDVQQQPRNWRWMRKSITAGPLVAGQASYTGAQLGANNVASWWHETRDYKPRVRNVNDPANEWPLHFMPYERFQALFIVGVHVSTTPQYWSVGNDGALLLGPTPDISDYRIRIDYRSKPTELVGDEDAPDMPEQFHMLLVWEGLKSVATGDASNEHYARAVDRADDLFDALVTSQAEKIVFASTPLA